jgi:hypothetical protein
MAGPPAWNPALTRWNAEHFKADRFVSGSSNGSVTLNFKGQVPLGPIPIEHVKWFAELAGQLRSEQVPWRLNPPVPHRNRRKALRVV